MRQEGAKSSLDSKRLVLQRVSLSLVLQLLLSLGLCVAVGALPELRDWVALYQGVAVACGALIVAIGVLCKHKHQSVFRGYLSYLLSMLFYPSIIYLLGGHAPVYLSQSSLYLGLSMLLFLAVLGWLYLALASPHEFLAYRVIPVGLMVTLAIYGGVLLALPQVYVGDLMLWTCISAVFTLYTALKMQIMTNDDYLFAEDFFYANVLLYVDFLPSVYSLLASSDPNSAQ